MRLLITVKFNTEKWEIRLSGKEKRGVEMESVTL